VQTLVFFFPQTFAPWQPENNRKKAYQFVDPQEKLSVFKKFVKIQKNHQFWIYRLVISKWQDA
jgi:hypothetical protein